MPGKTPVSIKQLAKMANLSIATVSRVLNNNGRFSDETRDLVMSLVRKTGYAPNVAARALRTRTARAIGLVVPDIANEFFSKIANSIERFFFENDYSLFVCNADEDLRRNQALLNNLQGKGIDGLIYISRFPVDYQSVGVPMVCLDRVPSREEGVATVGSDNLLGGRLAAKALLDAGCKRPVILCDHDDLIHLTTVHNRIEGFSQAMAAAKVPWTRENIIFSPLPTPEARANVFKAVRERRRFDGLFASSDTGAIGAIAGLEDAGLSVPDDVRVVGYDDISFCEYCKPTLTTIRQDTGLLGAEGARMLLSIIKNTPPANRHVEIPVKLIVRDSTGKTAGCGAKKAKT